MVAVVLLGSLSHDARTSRGCGRSMRSPRGGRKWRAARKDTSRLTFQEYNVALLYRGRGYLRVQSRPVFRRLPPDGELADTPGLVPEDELQQRDFLAGISALLDTYAVRAVDLEDRSEKADFVRRLRDLSRLSSLRLADQ